MKIKEVSEKFDISADTLRYYEKIGLIPAIARNKNGIRTYTEADLQTIEFVKCMRAAGLPIEVLINYLTLYKAGTDTVKKRKAILQDERDKLALKITIMQTTLDRLDKKIADYDEGFLNKEQALLSNKKENRSS